MNALSKVTSLEEVIWGIGLVAVTMIIHAFAMPMTLAVCSIAENRGQNWRSFFTGVRVLLLASGLIVITHLVEVAVWAIFFVVRDAFPNTSAAFYYSLLQYTTAGSDLSLPDRWRLLGGMIAIAGVLAFAWSTAVLLVLAQRFQHEQLKRMSIEAPVDQQ
jgi:hypothetical protein